MLTFAVRRRDPEAMPDWLADVDVAVRLGIDRATVWKWLDTGLLPEPKRVGIIRLTNGQKRSRTTRWLRAGVSDGLRGQLSRATAQVTQRYTHRWMSRLSEVAERLPIPDLSALHKKSK